MTLVMRKWTLQKPVRILKKKVQCSNPKYTLEKVTKYEFYELLKSLKAKYNKGGGRGMG